MEIRPKIPLSAELCAELARRRAAMHVKFLTARLEEAPLSADQKKQILRRTADSAANSDPSDG